MEWPGPYLRQSGPTGPFQKASSIILPKATRMVPVLTAFVNIGKKSQIDQVVPARFHLRSIQPYADMSILHLIFIIALVQVPVNSLYHRDVTAKSFDTLLDPSKAHLLIEFYAPWCGHVSQFPLLKPSFSTYYTLPTPQYD